MASARIIGLSGTNGSGKDSIGLLLAQKHNFLFISVSELLRQDLARRGLSTERANTGALSAEWRRDFGLSVLVDRAVHEFEKTGTRYAGLVVSSLRNPYEADRIHELDGVMVWVDADPKIRYARISGAARGRVDDQRTFEQFLAEEQREMHASGDAATLNMSAVKDRCDITILNESSDLNDLDRLVAKTLGL